MIDGFWRRQIMPLSAMTSQFARRIEQNDIDYSMSRHDGMRQAEGNPLGIEIRRYRDAFAFLIKTWPDFWYGNRVLGLEPSNENHLEEIIDFFRQHRLSFRFEITPGNINSRLASHLHKLGFCQTGFNTAVYGQPSVTSRVLPNKQVNVREVHPGEIDLFLDLYQDGFGLPRLNRDERRAVTAWLEQAKLNLYLCAAHVNAVPAGVGVLYINNGIGLLADATTLPEFRGKGCHAAMIHHRIVQAAERDCNLLTGFVEFGSVSHRNLESAGLRIAYTKAMWWAVE
jgi:hypothetical protein